MKININVSLDIGPTLITFGSKIMSVFDDITAKIDDLKRQAADEHTQVMAAIQALQDQLNTALSNSLTPDQLATVNTGFDDLKAAIGGVYEPTP